MGGNLHLRSVLASKRMKRVKRKMFLTTLGPEVTCNPGDVLQHVLEKFAGEGARYILHNPLQSLCHCEVITRFLLF